MTRLADPADFIRENLRLAPVPSVPEISLYTAHSASGLSGLTAPDDDAGPPYWAYAWGGGIVLARHVLDHPEVAGGRRVLDLGAGGGLVAIAAAKAGAASVLAAEIDPMGLAAIGVNAEVNGVTVATTGEDLLGGPPPRATDLVLVGDLFYERGLARRVTAFLDRCLAAQIEVLVGDPGRTPLPRSRLRTIAEYPTPDFGRGGDPARPAAVFAFKPLR
ncbi:MAG: SAM-dependent methyltransferase [Caulobacteraceae bacterium]|nr:SAM-dependent methyltransferase [Caulobacteraceae bacterium]